jgi:NUMOD4 motif.
MTDSKKVEWREIPGCPDYEVSTQGDVVNDHGRVEVENVVGSKAYILYRKDGAQLLVRPSELITRTFPEISEEEARVWDHFPRTAEKVRKDIVEVEAYYLKRTRQLYAELEQILKVTNKAEDKD